MKIRIDTEKKIITLEEDVNLGEFFTFLEKFFPNGEWQNYKVEARGETTIQPFSWPIINPHPGTYPDPNPWLPNSPWITYCNVNSSKGG